jgi:hypothetical protein
LLTSSHRSMVRAGYVADRRNQRIQVFDQKRRT